MRTYVEILGDARQDVQTIQNRLDGALGCAKDNWKLNQIEYYTGDGVNGGGEEQPEYGHQREARSSVSTSCDNQDHAV